MYVICLTTFGQKRSSCKKWLPKKFVYPQIKDFRVIQSTKISWLQIRTLVLKSGFFSTGQLELISISSSVHYCLKYRLFCRLELHLQVINHRYKGLNLHQLQEGLLPTEQFKGLFRDLSNRKRVLLTHCHMRSSSFERHY